MAFRTVLPEDRLHPSIRDRVAEHHRELIAEVEAAVAKHRVVVVGMAVNPYPRRARRALEKAGVDYHYLEYGSYFSEWRRRTALKMWTGWPTLPMIFVNGVFVGGATDLEKLIEAGELAKLLG